MGDRISVKLLFFGQLREIAGAAGCTRSVAQGCTTGELFEQIAAELPRLGALRGSIVLARNAAFVREPEMLAEGDEIAFLPPVSGGSGEAAPGLGGIAWLEWIQTAEGHFFGVTRDPIDGGRVARALLLDEDGAFVNFEGVVRNHSGGRRTRWLDYECYVPLAVRTMAGLGKEIAARHAVSRVAMVHRIGRLEIGETSVAVVVTSPHRRAAFEAALEGIDRLKTSVPVWKKEHFEDGEAWVEGSWDDSVAKAGAAPTTEPGHPA